MDVVAICTAPDREHWLADCLPTITYKPALVVNRGGWELDKLRWVFDTTDADRVLYLNDSCQVLDPGLFDLAFGASPGSVAFSTCPTKFGMYLGVFTRTTIEKLGWWPEVADKEDSIKFEREWADAYSAMEPHAPLLFDDFTDGHSTRTEVRHGRVNLVLENDYLIKFKGTWR